jgi:hypothetical protein
MVIGLAAVYLRLTGARVELPELRFSQALARRMAFASVLFVAATYIYVRTFARWGG